MFLLINISLNVIWYLNRPWNNRYRKVRMAYDSGLAVRIRRIVGRTMGVEEKEMFGGLSFLLKGRMFCGIIKNDLVVRVGGDSYEETLSMPHVRPMDFTGRPFKGFVIVEQGGFRTDSNLARWVGSGLDYVASLSGRRGK